MSDIELKIGANTQEAQRSIAELEQQLSKLEKVSDSSGQGTSVTSNDVRNLQEAAETFRQMYNNLTSSMSQGIEQLTDQMNELDRQLESAQASSNQRMSDNYQAQINYLDQQRRQLEQSISTADKLNQQSLQYGGGGSNGLPPSGGFSGLPAVINNGGVPATTGVSGPPAVVNSGVPAVSGGSNLPAVVNNTGAPAVITNSGVPDIFNGSTGGSGGDGGGISGPPAVIQPNEQGGSGGGMNLMGLVSSLGLLKKAAGYVQGGYNKMDTDEFLAYRVAQPTGDYGSDYRSAREYMEQVGMETGHTMSQTANTALTYQRIGGVTNTNAAIGDVKSIQEFGRAYAVDDNTMASAAGMMNRVGATGEGDQKKFANMLGESIKEQGMNGRESELVQSTSQLVQSIANNKLSVTGNEMQNVMALQNAFASISPQLKGSQGAAQLENFNNNITNADNNMQILLGRGTTYAGPEGTWEMRKQMEKGISDPENISKIFTNAEQFSKGNSNVLKLNLQQATGFSTDVIDALVDNEDRYNQLKSGNFSADALKGLQDASENNEDLNSKLKDFDKSGVSRRETYKAKKENVQKSVGDVADNVASPLQQIFNGNNNLEDTALLAGGTVATGLLANSIGASVKAGTGLSGGISNFAQGAAGVGGKFASGIPLIGGLISGVGDYMDAKEKGMDTGEAAVHGAVTGVGSAAGGWAGASAGAATGAALGSIIPGLGTVVGGGIGALVGGIGGSWAGGKVGGYAADTFMGNSSENVNSPDNIVDKRKKQQEEWKDTLDKEEKILDKRKEQQADSTYGGQSVSNDSSETNLAASGSDQKEDGGMWSKLKDWFKDLFPGEKSASAAERSVNYGVNGVSEVSGGGNGLSSSVEGLRSKVSTAAEKYGVSGNLDVLMAQLQQESGGQSGILSKDPFQAAESLGYAAGTNIGQEKSIDQGVKYFSENLAKAGGDTELALQGYNMGSGFIDFYNKNGYTDIKQAAKDFAAKQGGNYGDSDYVSHVLQYVPSRAIGEKSLASDGLVFAHAGEKIVRADENPDNPTNVFTTNIREDLGSMGSSSSSNVSGSIKIDVNVTGGVEGMNSSNQEGIAAALKSSFSNSENIMKLLSGGISREAK